MAAARPQPSASIQSTRTPASRAEAGFCAAARMASPSGVKRKKANSASSSSDRDHDHADLMRADVAGAGEGDLRERRGDRLDGVAPDAAGQRMEDRQQADEHHHHRQHGRVVQRPQDHALDADADQERKQRHHRQRDPEVDAPLQQLAKPGRR